MRSLFMLLLLVPEIAELNFWGTAGDFTGITLLDLIEDLGFTKFYDGLDVALVKAFLFNIVLYLEIVEGAFSRKRW